MPTPDRPHVTRSPSDPAARTRASDAPPDDLNTQYQSLPEVSQFTDSAIQQKVIAGLYHLRAMPQALNAFKLLIGAPYEARALRPYVLHHRPRVSQLALLSNNTHIGKLLDAFIAYPTPEHADKLVTIVASYSLAVLQASAVQDAYIHVATRITEPPGDETAAAHRGAWRRIQNSRLRGLNHLVRHQGFARLESADRTKLLEVFDNTNSGAYSTLESLLDDQHARFAVRCWRPMPTDVKLPILSLDFTSQTPSSTNRLLDHLHDLATSTSVPDEVLFAAEPCHNPTRIERWLRQRIVVAQVIDDCAYPDECICQGGAATCPWTSILNRLANMRPAEYARIAKCLILNGAVTFDWNANSTAANFYQTTFVPSLPVNAPHYYVGRFNPYAQGVTRIPIAPREGTLGWGNLRDRTVVQSVTQQSIQRFINGGNQAVTVQGSISPVDAAILAINMLGATRGFRLRARTVNVRTATPIGGESVCRVPTGGGWVEDLRGALTNGHNSVFLTFLWAPRAPSTGVIPHTCPDPNREPTLWEQADRHNVQLRSIGSDDGSARDPWLYFWNPWGAQDLQGDIDHEPAGADGNVLQVQSPVDANDQPTTSANVPNGTTWEVVSYPGASPGSRVSYGIGRVTSVELERTGAEFYYVDPVGPPWVSVAPT